MNDTDLLERITLNPAVMAGKPVIKETRVAVSHVLNLLAHGQSTEDILREYSGLHQEDVLACLLFGAKSLDSATFMPLTAPQSRDDVIRANNGSFIGLASEY